MKSGTKGQPRPGGPPQFTPAHAAALSAFLEAEAWPDDSKQIVLEPAPGPFGNFLCCWGVYIGFMSLGIGALTKPLQTFRGASLAPLFGLALDRDSLTIHEARNDCCCHVQTLHRTVPLAKVQDVDLTANWVHSMFGIQQLEVQTAGRGGEWEAGLPPPTVGQRGYPRDHASIQAAFLADPERARDAIRLAVRLHHGGHRAAAAATAAPVQAGPMARAAVPAGSGASGGRLAERLARLEALVARGTLTHLEAASVRAAVLAAAEDPTPRLAEVADLAAAGTLTAEELAAVKARWLVALI